ncbi:MAG: DALR anticodon-binding domain-containing protein, partial [Candidatus Binataceae bacterium]
AHARLASVFREAEKAGLTLTSDSAVTLELLSEEELGLIKRVVGLPRIVAAAVDNLEPHRLPFYLLEIAGDFHRYYNKPVNRIIDPERRELSMARLFLAGALKHGIAGGLALLGVSAPERM